MRFQAAIAEKIAVPFCPLLCSVLPLLFPVGWKKTKLHFNVFLPYFVTKTLKKNQCVPKISENNTA